MSTTKPEIDPETTRESMAKVNDNRHPSIVEWEATHKSQPAAVDVERELYLALKALKDSYHVSSNIKVWDAAKYQVDAAIKLYEQKGKL